MFSLLKLQLLLSTWPQSVVSPFPPIQHSSAPRMGLQPPQAGAGPGEPNTREGFTDKDVLLDNPKSQLLAWQEGFRVQRVLAEHKLLCPYHVPALQWLPVL